MYCSATFYYLPTQLTKSFELAKLNEKKEIPKKWFFSRRKYTGEKFLWEFLDENCPEKFDFPYSGFLIVDYFLSYLKLEGKYLKNLDGFYMTISYESSQELLKFLEENELDPEKLAQFLVVELSLRKSDLQKVLNYCKTAHDDMKRLLCDISADHFGIIRLSYSK